MSVWTSSGYKANDNGPCNGCLVVMNISDKIPLPESYRNHLCEKMAEAYAAGWLVLFLYDNKNIDGVPPDDLEIIEGQVASRLSVEFLPEFTVLDFSSDPLVRIEQFTELFQAIKNKIDIKSWKASFCGKCSIEGAPVFLPASRI